MTLRARCYIQCTTTGSSDITNYTVLNGDLHALCSPDYKTEISIQIQSHVLTNKLGCNGVLAFWTARLLHCY